jgi:MoxR-like ATPase
VGWSEHQLEQDPDMPAEVDDTDNSAVPDAVPLEPVERLTLEKLQEAARAAGLLLGDEIYIQLLAALISGKHVILTGPPGTAKTKLALVIAEVAKKAGVCAGYMPTTATADWTTYETIGGLRPAGRDSLQFQEGQFLQAMRKKEWLIIDELNRAQFDRAFGQLFTLLSGHLVVLPYSLPDTDDRPLVLLPQGDSKPTFACEVLEVPKQWRIIATMNVFDKTLLFQMSFALMRRFAFVEVASPSESVFEALIERAAAGQQKPAELAKRLLVLRGTRGIRGIKDLGPAVFMDLAAFLRARLELQDAQEGQLLFEGFYSYLLPQFEGIDDRDGERLYNMLRPMMGGEPLRSRLRDTLETVLGIELPSRSNPKVEAGDGSEEYDGLDDDFDDDGQSPEP